MLAFRVKLGVDDLHCVDVPLNPTHSLTHAEFVLDMLRYMKSVKLGM